MLTFPILLLALTFALSSCSKEKNVATDPETVISLELASNFSGKKAFAHLKKLTALGPRPSESAGYEAALVYLEKELHALGWQSTRQKFTAETPLGEVTFTTLLARRAPDKEPDWSGSVPYVIGSHLDTKRFSDITFLGVNDSGSSTAALLELARVLSRKPKSAAQVELVFFDGEESMEDDITNKDGLYGSKEYARQLRTRHNQPEKGIVLDLIGDPDVNILIDPTSSNKLLQATFKAVKSAGLGKRFVRSRGKIIDDHAPLQRIGGLDTQLIIGDFQKMPYWHTKNDTFQNVAPGPIREAGQVTLLILHQLSR